MSLRGGSPLSGRRTDICSSSEIGRGLKTHLEVRAWPDQLGSWKSGVFAEIGAGSIHFHQYRPLGTFRGPVFSTSSRDRTTTIFDSAI